MFLKVKVFPESKKEEVIESKNDSYLVYIKEKPEQGKANERVLEILSKHLKIEKEKLRIVKGSKGRSKIILIY
jgi:uncharacterized protein (TIGR00251 family)